MKNDTDAVRDEVLVAIERMNRTKLEKLRIFMSGMEAAKKQKISGQTKVGRKRVAV